MTQPTDIAAIAEGQIVGLIAKQGALEELSQEQFRQARSYKDGYDVRNELLLGQLFSGLAQVTEVEIDALRSHRKHLEAQQ